ncbi:GntR family transcriptional regulator [Lederbergia graminis]|uniref:GntR family transcriptional regulator n=1 Tax=Lederbergia graminis TaxID=735518 RepID=A0ABW0LJQ7_9BACI
MKIPIHISEDSREPIYHQVEMQIKTMIASGQLKPGSSLPSIRALASELGCSVITTRRAYQNLEASGFIKTAQGKGTFVREMETTMKEETKHKVVQEGLEKAIEQGMQVGISEQELHSIFRDIMVKKFKNGG